MTHEVTRALISLGGVKMLAVRCSCGKFEVVGKRLSVADRRKNERLASQHLSAFSCQPEALIAP